MSSLRVPALFPEASFANPVILQGTLLHTKVSVCKRHYVIPIGGKIGAISQVLDDLGSFLPLFSHPSIHSFSTLFIDHLLSAGHR